MVNNFDYIVRWLYDMNVKKFSVWEAGKGKDENGRSNGNAIKLNGDEPIEEKIDTFRDWCDNNTGSFILVQQDGNSYNSELRFMLPFRRQEQAAPLAVASPSVGTVPAGYYSEREFQTQLENERLKMRLERLEEEAKEYKQAAQQSSSAANEFFKTVTPFVGPVLQGLFGKKMATAQIGSLDAPEQMEEPDEPEQVTEDGELDIPDELFKRLTEDLKRWEAADKDYLDLIHKLSQLTSDPMYNTAKQMILTR